MGTTLIKATAVSLASTAFVSVHFPCHSFPLVAFFWPPSHAHTLILVSFRYFSGDFNVTHLSPPPHPPAPPTPAPPRYFDAPLFCSNIAGWTGYVGPFQLPLADDADMMSVLRELFTPPPPPPSPPSSPRPKSAAGKKGKGRSKGKLKGAGGGAKNSNKGGAAGAAAGGGGGGGAGKGGESEAKEKGGKGSKARGSKRKK